MLCNETLHKLVDRLLDEIRAEVERLLGYEPGEGLREGPGAGVWAMMVGLGRPQRIDREESLARKAADFARKALRRAGLTLPSETVDMGSHRCPQHCGSRTQCHWQGRGRRCGDGAIGRRRECAGQGAGRT